MALFQPRAKSQSPNHQISTTSTTNTTTSTKESKVRKRFPILYISKTPFVTRKKKKKKTCLGEFAVRKGRELDDDTRNHVRRHYKFQDGRGGHEIRDRRIEEISRIVAKQIQGRHRLLTTTYATDKIQGKPFQHDTIRRFQREHTLRQQSSSD